MRTSCTDSETVCAGVFDGLIWFERAIKDPELAAEARAVEEEKELPAGESRDRILQAVERRYTLPS